MPTPNGVNYLLQFLITLSNSPIVERQESKVDVQSYVLISLSIHTHISLVITHYLMESAVWTESVAKLRKIFDFKYFLLVFQQKIFRIVCRFKKMHYLCRMKAFQTLLKGMFRHVGASLLPLYVICSCACALALVACHDDDPAEPAGPGLPGKELRHTAIFYIAGENSLGQFVSVDSAEIAQAAELLPEDVRVVLFIDDTKSSRLCVKSKDYPMQTVKTYASNVVATDSASMYQILNDIMLTFPSKSYGLVCWSHATGWLFQTEESSKAPSRMRTASEWTEWQDGQTSAETADGTVRKVRRRTFGVDNGIRSSYSDSGPQLSIPAMAGLLSNLPHLDYVMFDACFMQCVEVAYELRNVCDWVISSPAEIPGDGAPYEQVLPLLCANPFSAEAVIDAYHAYYDHGAGYRTYFGVELSAISTAGMEALAQATRPCVQQIWGERREAVIEGVQYYTTRSDYPAFYDMQSLFYHNLPAEQYAE